MKHFALIASLMTLALPTALHANTIAPGVDLTLTNGTVNETFTQITPGTFVFTDGLSTVTAVYVSTGLGDVLSVTDACATVGTIVPCKQYSLSVTDANFGPASLGLGVSAFAANHTQLAGDNATVTLDGSLALGTDTLDFTGPPVNNSPVPEPASLGLVASGLAGGAEILRRRRKL